MNRPMNIARPAPAVALTAFALVVAACVSGGQAGWTYAPLGPTPSASAAASGSPSASGSPAASGSPSTSGSPAASGSPGAGGTFELEETNTLQILQAGAPVTELHVTVGQTYNFRINNTAGFTHNFYLGPPEQLSADQVEGLPGVPVNETGVQEFSWTATAEATGWEFACTVPGHYQSMRGALVVDGH